MDPSNSVDFATAARELTRVARRRGLVGPSFRCPPRLVGVDRSIRRRPQGAVVSVRLRGRPWPAVLADMIEGVVVANALGSPQADRLRADLWAAMRVDAVAAAPATSAATSAGTSGHTRTGRTDHRGQTDRSVEPRVA